MTSTIPAAIADHFPGSVRRKSGSGMTTPQQIASSKCSPVMPKSYGITPVKELENTGDFLVETANVHFFNITPILPVFSPSGGSPLVSKIESQLTCVKAIDETVASRAIQSPKDTNKTSGASGRRMMLMGYLGMITSFITFLVGSIFFLSHLLPVFF